MRVLLSIVFLFSLFIAGCGDPEPQPIEGPDPADEISTDEAEAERELGERDESEDDTEEEDSE